eukprot:4909472-Pyramimonas_sp.AAC.2
MQRRPPAPLHDCVKSSGAAAAKRGRGQGMSSDREARGGQRASQARSPSWASSRGVAHITSA